MGQKECLGLEHWRARSIGRKKIPSALRRGLTCHEGVRWPIPDHFRETHEDQLVCLARESFHAARAFH